MTGRLELVVNNRNTYKRDIAGWGMVEQVMKEFHEYHINILSESDTWEIALVIKSDFKADKAFRENKFKTT